MTQPGAEELAYQGLWAYVSNLTYVACTNNWDKYANITILTPLLDHAGTLGVSKAAIESVKDVVQHIIHPSEAFCKDVYNVTSNSSTQPMDPLLMGQLSPEQILAMEFEHFFSTTMDITDRYGTDTTVNGFMLNAAVNFSIFIFCLILFSCLRPRIKKVYEPRMIYKRHNKPPTLDSSFLAWTRPLYEVDELDMLRLVGVDALALLRTYILGLQIFAVNGFFAMFILLPIYFFGGSLQEDLFARATVFNLAEDSMMCGLVAAFSYIFTIVSLFFINLHFSMSMNDRYCPQERFIELRLMWLQTRPAQYYTVLVSNMKNDQKEFTWWVTKLKYIFTFQWVRRRGPQAEKQVRDMSYYSTKLEDLFNTLVPGQLKGYIVNRTTGKLQKLHDKREKADSKLKSACRKLARNPDERPKVKINKRFGCGGEEVDAIRHYYQEVVRLNGEYTSEQRLMNTSTDNAAGYAFATFNTITAAAVSTQVLLTNSYLLDNVEMAPEPMDIYWKNMKFVSKPFEKFFRTIGTWTITWFLIFFWNIPVTIAMKFTSPAFICSLADQPATCMDDNFWLKTAFEGYIPAGILAGILAIVPTIARGLGHWEGLHTFSKIDHAQLRKVYLFDLVNVILVASISPQVVLNPVSSTWGQQTVWEILGATLPQMSLFYINFIMVMAFTGFLFELIQVFRWFWVGCVYLFIRSKAARAKQIEPFRPEPGWWFPRAVLIMTIGFIYLPLSPIITPFVIVYFCIGFCVMKYNLLYVYKHRYQSGGLMYVSTIRRLLVGIIMAQVTNIGFFLFRQSPIALVVMPLPAFTCIAWYFLEQAYHGPSCKIPVTISGLLDALDEEDPRERDPVEDVYVHPLLIADPVIPPPKEVLGDVQQQNLPAFEFDAENVDVGPVHLASNIKKRSRQRRQTLVESEIGTPSVESLSQMWDDDHDIIQEYNAKHKLPVPAAMRKRKSAPIAVSRNDSRAALMASQSFNDFLAPRKPVDAEKGTGDVDIKIMDDDVNLDDVDEESGHDV